MIYDPDKVLLPYQSRAIFDDASVVVIEKARRVGMSWAMAAMSIEHASSVSGSDVWYLSYNKDMTREFIRDCANFASFFNEDYQNGTMFLNGGKEGDDVLAYQLRFASGNNITALSSHPRNLRSKQGLVIIDEAAFVDDLQSILKAAMSMLVWGGRVVILSTHNGVDSQFSKLIQDGLSGKIKISHHKITFDDAIEEGLYRRICDINGTDWSEHGQKEWRDEIVKEHGENALIERAMDARCGVVRINAEENFSSKSDEQRRVYAAAWCSSKIDPVLLGLDKSRMYFIGQDFGRSSDLSVIAICYIDQKMNRVIACTIELWDVPFTEQEQILKHVCASMPRLGKVAIDGTGNGQYLGERIVQHLGAMSAESVSMSEKWYAENLPYLKSLFQDDTIKIPRDSDVMADLMALTVINGSPRLPKEKTSSVKIGARRKTRHGDSAVAIALACYCSRGGGNKIEYSVVKSRPNLLRL
jgi:phage FluMu gp28-like protein